MRWTWGLVLVAVLAAACGDDTTVETAAPPSPSSEAPPSTGGPTGVAPADATAWVAGALPSGFAPVYADENDGTTRTILYSSRGCGRDVYDSALTVTTGPDDDVGWAAQPGDPEIQFPDGTSGTAVTLRSDGDDYGYGASWRPADGVWVSVTAAEPLGLDDLRTVLGGLRGVDDAEWSRLARALSIDTHVGRLDADPDEVEAVVGTAEGETFVLTGLIPGDYPLGEDDCRRACVQLDYAGATSGPNCEGYPVRVRLADEVFIFGVVDPGTTEVTFSPTFDVGGEPVAAAVVNAPGWPNGLYAAHIPEEWCFFVSTAPGGEMALGEGGVLPSDPEHAACLAAIPSTVPSAPSDPGDEPDEVPAAFATTTHRQNPE